MKLQHNFVILCGNKKLFERLIWNTKLVFNEFKLTKNQIIVHSNVAVANIII